VADGTDLATAILDVSVQSQRGLKARPNVSGGIVDSAATLAQRQPSQAPLVNDCARSNKSRQKRPSDLQAHE